jgi:hypothetical protein
MYWNPSSQRDSIWNEGDTDMDGTVDFFHDYKYDSRGRKTLETEDNDTSLASP